MAQYRLLDVLYASALPTSTLIKALRDTRPLTHNAENSEGTMQILENREKGAREIISDIPADEYLDSIYLVDIDFKPNSVDPQTGLSTTKYYDTLRLNTVPMELNYDPDPQWATIASIGRNAPFYHYTGSEDTLSFQIDWFSKEDHRKDVIYACRWLESLSKSNSYKEDPHRIMIMWGKANELFLKSLWIVHKASYKLSQFQRHRSMLPQQAYQEVVLKRVLVENSNTSDVFGSSSSYSDIGIASTGTFNDKFKL